MTAIETQILSINDSQAIPLALKTLANDELIVFPTDTLYGLAGRIKEVSIRKIFQAKERPEEKSIPVLFASVEQLAQLTDDINPKVLALIKAFLPGPLTLVLPKKAGLPPALSNNSGVALRMPDHPFALDLLAQSGPLAVTSANISGYENLSTAQEVYAQLTDRVSLILDSGSHPGGLASTIINCQQGEPQLLRQGPLSIEEILKVWRNA
ncbi:MAG: threonylcarbamoyl-AMP synthase [Anaerolineaceae bacterium]|nr:threonylcarbamoyl-AMP synthase [Anaerolineaceae bacterium]